MYYFNPTLDNVIQLDRVPTLQEMYKLICVKPCPIELVEYLRIPGSEDSFIFDEEGLYNDHDFEHDVYLASGMYSIKGPMLLLGADDEGNSIGLGCNIIVNKPQPYVNPLKLIGIKNEPDWRGVVYCNRIEFEESTHEMIGKERFFYKGIVSMTVENLIYKVHNIVTD